MKSRVLFIIRYWLFFVVVFLLQKPVFIFFNQQKSVDFINWLKVVYYGSSMDFSTAGYLTIIPLLLTIVSVWIQWKWLDSFLKIYSGAITTLVSVIIVSDMQLFGFWGTHLDNTAIFYLKSPIDAAASISYWRIFFGVVLISALAYLFYRLLIRFTLGKTFSLNQSPGKKIHAYALFLLIPVLVITLRGGVGTSTMNVGHSYFSSDLFLNLSAVNPCFNLLYSLNHQDTDKVKYDFMSDEEVNETFDTLKEKENEKEFPRLLNQKRPNVILIVMESFSAKIIEPLGGTPNVAPRLNSFCKEGILFSNFYANSFRTDRGLLAILSAMPSLPTIPLMRYAEKLNKLPSISTSLKKEGYDLSMLYGGDINFANMRQYFVCSGFENIECDIDFPISQRLSKWGVPDHVTFDHLGKKLRKPVKEPFMQMFLTLSSHEPFEVPCNRFENPYLNSIAYSDSCIGDFIDKLKATPAWKSTLVVLVADHSFRYPETLQNCEPERYRIPMLWLGGAIKEPMRIDTLGAQTDIAATLLEQMDIPAKDFTFSRNILKNSTPKMAFYTYINGFGFVTPGSASSYDCGAKQIVFEKGKEAPVNDRKGKAMLQYLLTDFKHR